MSNKIKPRLGRGLSSLISLSQPSPNEAPPVVSASPDVLSPPTTDAEVGAIADGVASTSGSTDATSNVNGLQHIALDQIVPNPHQPRRLMNEGSLAELASSLRITGLIQPIVVRKSGTGFELIAGERRWRAAKLAGLRTIPAVVRNADAFEQAQMALVENIQRENLNPIDRALAYRTLMTQLGLTQSELASRMGEERSSIANFLRLLDLAPPVQQMVIDNQISMGHAKIIAGLADLAEQMRLANLVIAEGLSVRKLEQQLQQPNPPAEIKTAAILPPSAHLANLERSISQQLGVRVQLRAGAQKGKGKLILHYGSLDQFDDLVGRLGVKIEP